MKVLILYGVPFGLAHGGLQVQIEQTRAGLEAIGVEVEWLRWWDERQTGDILHYYGRVPGWMIPAAHGRGMKVVSMELLTEPGSRPMSRLRMQRWFYRGMEMLKRVKPGLSYSWDIYHQADAFISGTEWERFLTQYVYGAAPERTHVVPNGVEDVFFNSPVVERGPWLVCTATITGRKRILELAMAAVRAQTPVWIIGKPYSDTDEYGRGFLEFARQHPKFIRYEGPVTDRQKLAGIYRAARGFVLLSAMETLSLSSGEATACRCPLLLSDLPWARSAYGDTVAYCPITNSLQTTAEALARFYAAAPTLKPPPEPPRWPEVGRMFEKVYAGLLKTSR